jgi:hypothetical protein
VKIHLPSSRALLLIALLAGLLATCSTPEAAPTPTATNAPTPPRTRTAIPTATERAEITTSTPPSSVTPSLSATQSAPAVECPQPSDQTVTISPIGPESSIVEGFEPQILEYLNVRGSADGLEAILSKLTLTDSDGTTWQARTQVISTDVTGDTTPDVVIDLSFFVEGQYADGAVFAFMCRQGQYEGGAVTRIGGAVLTSESPDPGIRAIQDMNGNGVPEIVLSYIEVIGTHVNFTRLFRIIEWDGEQFVDLIESDDPNHPNAAEVNNGDGTIYDTDGDGTAELVLTNGPGRGPDAGTPDHPRTEVWAWNGSAFTLVRPNP